MFADVNALKVILWTFLKWPDGLFLNKNEHFRNLASKQESPNLESHRQEVTSKIIQGLPDIEFLRLPSLAGWKMSLHLGQRPNFIQFWQNLTIMIKNGYQIKNIKIKVWNKIKKLHNILSKKKIQIFLIS